MLSKVAIPQETTKYSTIKKPNRVATVRQQPTSCNRQVRKSTEEPTQSPRFSSMTLPSGMIQPQAGSVRYPFYRMQTPQMVRQTSVPNSPCCSNGQYPRFPMKTPNHLVQTSMGLPYPNSSTISSNTLSCIATPMTQRHARYISRHAASPEETSKPPSSASSSRDSGILSQDSSTSSQSFPNDDYISNFQQQMNGFRTPQCAPKRAKPLAKNTIVDPPVVKFRGNTVSSNATLNRSRVASSVNSGSKIPSAVTSDTSSPATPRASWNSGSSTSVGKGETNKSGNKVGRSTSICSGTLERENKSRLSNSEKRDLSGLTASSNIGRIPRPTNLARERSPRGEKELSVTAKTSHQSLSAEEKSPKNCSLPGPERQIGAMNTNSHIPTLRAKTLSPPPQFASSKTSSIGPQTTMTPDSSSTSTCTLAATSRDSSTSLSNRDHTAACSNLDDTPTPSNRETPEPNFSSKQATINATDDFNNLPALAVPTSPKTPRVSPRVTLASEDQSRSSLGYGPLSHIKLPYSTPMLQRTQTKSNSGSSVSSNSGIYAKREKSSIYAASAGGQPISDSLGSHMSLSSSGSAISPGTESPAFESAKLRRELELAHQKIAALTCQLSANTTVVQAFEQSLQSMNQRLHQISASSALKERELQELRKIIEKFRCQALQSDWSCSAEMAKKGKKLSQSQEIIKSQHIIDSDMMLQQAGSLSSLVHSPHTISNFGGFGRYVQQEHSSGGIQGYMTPNYMPIRDSFDRSNKKGGSWLRSSINRAFRRSKSRDPPDRAKVTSTSSSHDVNVPSPGRHVSILSTMTSSSVHHSPTSSSGESPSTTDKNLCSEEEGGEGMVGGEMMLEMMQETVRSLQYQVRCLRAENAFLQRAVDRCSTVNSAESSSDKVSLTTSRGSTGAFSYSTASSPLKIGRLLRELFPISPENGQHIVPVFIELNYKPTSDRPGSDIANIRRNTTPSSPRQHHLQPPCQQVSQVGCASPNIGTRMLGASGNSEELSHLHLIGRICLDQSSSELMTKVKNLFQIYLSYLDSDDQLGLNVNSISSVCITITPQSISSEQQPKEILLSPLSTELNSPKIEIGCEISRIKISLHDNAYVLEKPDAPSLLNPLAVSSIAWISLLSASLLGKMIESLLANKFVIIYGPRGSGKLEFGRILIDSMAKMFPGFWSTQPTAIHYYLRASSNAVNELRQVLMNTLLSVEGLIILRLPPSLLSDLINITTELGFNTHPRKILLLAITDTLIFPEEPTKLRSCPGIFPFLADIQSASSYMRRCLRQRFSQFAFQCLDVTNLSNNATELDALTEVIEWLPEFWLRCITTSAWNSLSNSEDNSASTFTFVLSPFRLLACPLTLKASSLWFGEVCDSEGIFRKLGESNGDLMRWLAATWPWPNEKLPFVFAPFDHSTGGLHLDPIMTSSNASMASSSMLMYDSSASLPALLSSNANSGTGRCIRITPPCPILRR